MSDTIVLLVTIADTGFPTAGFHVHPGLPKAIRGDVYEGYFTPEGGTPPYTYAITSGSLPAGMSMGTDGVVTGTPTTQGYYEFQVEATDMLGAIFSVLFSITVQGGLTFDTTEIPDGEHGIAYSAQLVVSGGTPPYTFAVQSGPFPFDSLAASGPTAGLISDTSVFATVTVQKKTFIIRATDSVGNYTDQVYSVYLWPAMQFNGSTIVDGLQGLPYDGATAYIYGSFNLYPNEKPTATWTISSGSLPPGLTLNPSSGHIVGTPTVAGVYPFDLTVTDSLGGVLTASIDLRIHDVRDIDSIFKANFGDGSNTDYTIVHNLNIPDYVPKSVSVYDTSLGLPYQYVEVAWEVVDQDTIRVVTHNIVSTDAYYIVITA